MKYINESLSSIQQSDDNNPATAYKKAVLTNILHMYDNLDATISSNTFTFESFNPKYDKNMTIYIYPVGYSIPSTVVVEKRPQKSKTFSTVIPGNFSTYISKESAYIEELAESLFVVTYKKAGWVKICYTCMYACTVCMYAYVLTRPFRESKYTVMYYVI